MSRQTTIIIDDKYRLLNAGTLFENGYKSVEKNELDVGTLRLFDDNICVLRSCNYKYKKRKFLFSYEKYYEMHWIKLNFERLENKSLRDLINHRIKIDKQEEKLLKAKKELELEKQKNKMKNIGTVAVSKRHSLNFYRSRSCHLLSCKFEEQFKTTNSIYVKKK